MLRAVFLLALALAGANAGSQEGNPGNFDDIVVNSGKNSLVKFQAPW